MGRLGRPAASAPFTALGAVAILSTFAVAPDGGGVVAPHRRSLAESMDRRLPSLILDFDSTVISVEGADELFAHSLTGAPDREERVARFREITDLGMAGEIPYQRSLELRLALLDASRDDVAWVGRELVAQISPSFQRARAHLERHAYRIWIVSGGFEELIRPVALELGLRDDRIHAHRFSWSGEGRLTGVDPRTPLALGGKLQAVRMADIPGPRWVIGDGATDRELREEGLAERFYAFVENRTRPGIREGADGVLTSILDLPTLD